jgi:AbrB family looped-hinge helix DNA binding protein
VCEALQLALQRLKVLMMERQHQAGYTQKPVVPGEFDEGTRMNPIEVSLDNLGRILIPPAIRSRLGLSPGMILIVEEGDNGGVKLRIQSESPVLVDKGGVLVVRAEPLSDLTNITRHERDRRAFDLSQRAGL